MHGGYINKGGLSANASIMPLRSLGQHLTPLITLEMSTTSKCISLSYSYKRQKLYPRPSCGLICSGCVHDGHFCSTHAQYYPMSNDRRVPNFRMLCTRRSFWVDACAVLPYVRRPSCAEFAEDITRPTTPSGRVHR